MTTDEELKLEDEVVDHMHEWTMKRQEIKDEIESKCPYVCNHSPFEAHDFSHLKNL